MAKQINLIVNSCGECKTYIYYRLINLKYYCRHPELHNVEIDDLKIIHPDCPLEDVKEENKCINCIYLIENNECIIIQEQIERLNFLTGYKHDNYKNPHINTCEEFKAK